MKSLFFLVAQLFLAFFVISEKSCQPFHEYKASNDCLESCQQHDYCPTSVHFDYFCQKNYKRHPITEQCVPETECPCRGCKNEEFNDCANPCGDGCFDEAHNCLAMCQPRCSCKIGFKRKNGICVSAKDCSLCPPFEIRERSNKCNESCFSHLVKDGCSDSLVPSCYCQKGYKRELDGKCVPEGKCSKTPICSKPNEEFKSDGIWCQDFCNKHARRCLIEPTPGCYCKEGFARDLNGNCVKYFGPQKGCNDFVNQFQCGKTWNDEIAGNVTENEVV